MNYKLKQIGRLVKEQRKAVKITQKELASRIGTTPGYISRLEAGKCNPTIMTLSGIAVKMGCRLKINFVNNTI